MEIDEKLLNAGLISQLRSALPPVEMINKLKECSEEELKNVPEGEQVRIWLFRI
jgi:hypothetical protein